MRVTALVLAAAGCAADPASSTAADGGAPRDFAVAAPPDLAPARDLATAPDMTKAPEPPPYPAYSGGVCPKLVAGPDADTSLNVDFVSAGDKRNFRLLVPKSYDPNQPTPLMFAWHWLNASSASFIKDGELDTAAEQMGFIAVLPDNLRDGNGNKVYQFDWPFAETWGVDKELAFFDDLLACVSEQYNVDHHRVYGVGVSAGALWVTYVSTTARVQYLAAVESLSGGLGELDPFFKMEFKPQPNKFPALVLWGGDGDWFILDFATASKRYRDALVGDHHFVVTCTHDAGHAMPPIPAPMDGSTRFKPLWEFLLAHPYGLPAGTSPWQQTGLPSDAPGWCKIVTP